MRAMVVTEFGAPAVMRLTDVPEPVPDRGTVLVDVAYSDVGTLDRLVRSGWGREYFDVAPPYVPGDGVGGTVRAVGPGVDGAWVGRQVVGGTGPRNADGLSAGPTGGYADAAVVDVRALVPVPDDLSLCTATALLNDGPTSQLLIDVADPRAGDTVLVLAAAGAGGMLLTRLAVHSGARVVAAAHGARKCAAVRALGVEQVIDYADPGWAAQVRDLTGDGPTVVLDGAGGDLGREAFSLALDGGRFLTYGSSAGSFAEPDRKDAARRGIAVSGLFELPALTAQARNDLVRRAFASAAVGRAEPRVTLLPLEQAGQAHEALESRAAIGKTLLTHGQT